MNEKQLAKLIKKNAAKAEELAKRRSSRAHDQTLPVTNDDEETIERDQFFKEMKRREF